MRVKTDTSEFTIDRILMQQFEVDSQLHWLSVVYYSKKLLDTETQYDTDEQELLIIVKVIHHWCHYCWGVRHQIVVLMNHANLVWFMTTSNLTQRQLKWAEKLAEYDFKVTYWEGKKNSADDLLRQSDYKLSKTVNILTAAEMIWQFFCLRSKNYKSVQKELYTLTAMTLQLKHSVWQLQQNNVIISTVNTEDSDVTETLAVCDLHAQKACYNKYDTDTSNTEDSNMTETSAVYHLLTYRASCNGNDKSVMSDSENDSTTETSAVHDHYAQEASCDKYDTDTTNTEDSDMTETSAVHDLSAQEASCNDKSVMSETDSTTETSAVYHQYAQRASCVMSEEISDITEAHTVQHLSAQKVSWDSVRRLRYAEPQQHSIKDSAANTAAININNTVNHDLIDL